MNEVRRRACLDAMGIPLWVSRQAPAAREDSEAVGIVDVSVPAASESGASKPGEQLPGPRTVVAAEAPAAIAETPPSKPATGDCAGLGWDELAGRVSACRACSALCDSRTQTVFGVGNTDADLMIIGEAPGAEEDRRGEPFVGRAGKLLDAMLAAIGLDRSRVYIANILKCRPPGNRNPGVEEAAACRPFLQRQIELVNPRLILSLGAVSAHNLLQTEEAVGRLRRREHRYPGSDIPVRVSYHPAYLLRRPEEKAKSWEDLQAAWRHLREGEA